MASKILIVDDEKNIRLGLSTALQQEGYETVVSEDGQEGWNRINQEHFDLVISDIRMPNMGGIDLLKQVSSAYPRLPVIVLTGHGTIETAVTCMQHGAYDFITKPVNLDRLALMVDRALGASRLIEENQSLKEEVKQLKEAQLGSKILAQSSVMDDILEKVRSVAITKSSVLITGESGVGKELVADAIHQSSPRKDGPFVKVHCAALSESLLESELFGHEKGSFTGALHQKIGRFERADGGTIFLDEIGEINNAVQVKILRVLQERTLERVGGAKELPIDIRLVSATNKNLEEEVAAGRFREDLFYRLNVVHIHVPPLRERMDDVPLLAEHFLKEFAQEMGKDIAHITKEGLKRLTAYHWPGNIRELRNVIESAVVFAKGKTLGPSDFSLTRESQIEREGITIASGTSLADAERELILKTLENCKGNKSKAAELLDISRKTLHRKLDSYGSY